MKLLIGLVIFLSASVVSAQSNTGNLTGLGISPEKAGQINKQYSTAIKASQVPATDNSVSLGSALKQWASAFIGSFVVYGAGASDKYPAAAVITPSTSFPTPSAGNTLLNRHTIIAAGAPTATFVVHPAATAVVGQPYTVYNQSSNPAAIVPAGGAINAAAALTPYSCPAGAVCECRGLTTSVIGCE